MTNISLDKQLVKQICPHCQEDFSACRGSVYDESKPVAIYLAAMHKCFQGKTVHLAIGFTKGYQSLSETSSIMMSIVPTEKDFEVRIIEPNDSPWKDERYLGHMMKQEEARTSSLKETLFHIVDHIVLNVQEINDYLES